ncbi:MAG: CRISPR-associated endonuclease Cas1 [Bacillota bacterium]
MQLVINTYGSYLHRDQNCFELKTEEKKTKISTKKVDSILITTGASISTDAVELAIDNNIEIQFLNKYGQPIGKVWHSKLGSTTYIRRRQLEIAETAEGTEIVKDLITRKLNNSTAHLEDLARRRSEEKANYIQEKIDKINKFKDKIKAVTGPIADVRNQLMGYEGNVGRNYFSALSYLLPERFQFSGRSYRPAQDEFNCLLNYGYGVLYSKVEKACIIAGLDPYVGIMHTDGYNKKSFVFDAIEPYRYRVDKVVMKLFSRKKVKTDFFDELNEGLTLNEAGKEVLIKNLNQYFDKKVRHDGRNMRVEATIEHDLHQLANRLIED